MKKEGKKEKENNYTIRILWNVAPFILPSGETNGILRKLSCENAMKLNPRERSGWRLCSTILSLSLSLISAVALFSFSAEKREMFVSKRFEQFHRGSTRLSGNLSWCRSCGAALPIQTTRDGTKKEKENKKKNSRGIACNGFTNNRKKDVNEKSNWIFALYENTHGEYTL